MPDLGLCRFVRGGTMHVVAQARFQRIRSKARFQRTRSKARFQHTRPKARFQRDNTAGQPGAPRANLNGVCFGLNTLRAEALTCPLIVI